VSSSASLLLLVSTLRHAAQQAALVQAVVVLDQPGHRRPQLLQGPDQQRVRNSRTAWSGSSHSTLDTPLIAPAASTAA
jgi:hypothetical protein